MSFCTGSGGLKSSTLELTKYMKFLLNIESNENAEILSKDSLEHMWTNQIQCNLTQRALNDIKREGYGYGWIVIEKYLNEKIVYHLGGGPATSTGIWLVPDKKIGVSILCNMGGAGQEILILIPLVIISALLDIDPFMNIKYFKKKELVQILTGNYASYDNYCPIEVISEGFQLYLRAEPNPELDWGINVPLIPTNEDLNQLSYYYISGPGCKSPVEFIIRETNEVEMYWNNLKFLKIANSK